MATVSVVLRRRGVLAWEEASVVKPSNCGRSARIGRGRYSELFADRPYQAGAYVFVSREGGHLVHRAAPLRVLRPTDGAAAVSLKMAFEVASFHAAAVKRKCSRSESGA